MEGGGRYPLGVPGDPLDRLRKICAQLPEAKEGTTVHHPSFNVRGKTFVMLVGDDYPSLWVKCTREEQQELIATDDDRFFVPPYLGPKGWIGIRLGGRTDWQEATEIITDGYRLAAPKRLLRLLGD